MIGKKKFDDATSSEGKERRFHSFRLLLVGEPENLWGLPWGWNALSTCGPFSLEDEVDTEGAETHVEGLTGGIGASSTSASCDLE